MLRGPDNFQIEHGKKFSTASFDDLEKLVNSKTDFWNAIEFTSWEPASKNPKLTSELIGIMLEKLTQNERYCNVTRKQNRYAKDRDYIQLFDKMGKDRAATIDNLTTHKNFGDDNVNFIIDTLKKPYYLLNSPALKVEHLDTIFDKLVVQGQYDLFLFSQIMNKNNKLITSEMLSRWYGVLKQFADWGYGNNGWSRIIAIFLSNQKCPFELLKDVASARKAYPFSIEESDKLRNLAINHPLGNKDELMMMAYAATEDTQYLSDDAKAIFLF